MTSPGFLLDENLPPALAWRLRQIEPAVRVLAIGSPDAPVKGTPDSDILRWIEERNCLLVTNNRTSMPGQLQAHLAGGGHIPGILITPYPLNIGWLVEALLLIWGAALPDEFRDQIVYLASVS